MIKTRQNGNAMVYILIAIALFGALTLTLSRQNDGADGQNISDEQAELYALELMQYVASAQNTIDMMLSTGTEVSELDFVIPSDPAFNTGSNVHKVFHPQGGGLNYQEKFSKAISDDASYQWFIQTNLNVEWTETPANDAIMVATYIKQSICEKINEQIMGNAIIPALTVDLDDIFDPDGASETAFDTSNCPDCDGYSTLCVSNNSADTYGFYNIVAAR